MFFSGSVFGIVILEVKAQLEKLLRLPPGSLLKEVRLTEDILELFTKYQIPSDLISASLEGLKFYFMALN